MVSIMHLVNTADGMTRSHKPPHICSDELLQLSLKNGTVLDQNAFEIGYDNSYPLNSL